jgi:hypothetical protein
MPLRIAERKSFNIMSLRTSKIAVMDDFADIYRYDKGFFIDYFEFFCFSFIHGYAPSLIWVNQLTTASNQRV